MEAFNGRMSSFPDDLRSKLIESVCFEDRAPTEVEIQSAKIGKARTLELEELFTRLAFDWRRKNSILPIRALPWVSNLSAEINLHLREVAVTALVKSGRA